jgi:hypothetical protein
MTDWVRPPRQAWAAVRRIDLSAPAEWAVLYTVLGIAALVSYTHLRYVWDTLEAPWPYLGPLTVDGLFAAAWLRMRRRRRDGVTVGPLAWVALAIAFVATLAGNTAAAFPTWLLEHRDAVAPIVFAWPAAAFALVWELVTGHARRVTQAVTEGVTPPVKKTVTPPTPPPAAKPAAVAPVADEQKKARSSAADRAARYRARKAAEKAGEVAA